jgi:hypothetical protein
VKADHGLVNGRAARTRGAIEQAQGSLQGLLGALRGAELPPKLTLVGGELLLREGKQAPVLRLWGHPRQRLPRPCEGGLGGRPVAKRGVRTCLQ